jgi:hypothetical protein
MKPVYFRGVNYDPILLAALSSQGFRQTVATENISDLVSHKTSAVRIAVVIDAKYHLLTGSIDRSQATQALIVVTTYVLKKAAIAQMQYTDRQAASRQEFATSRDFNPQFTANPPMRNSPRFR